MQHRIEIHEPKGRSTISRSENMRASRAVRAATAFMVVALLSFLAGCGIFSRERVRETPTVPAAPPITETVQPTIQAVQPTTQAVQPTTQAPPTISSVVPVAGSTATRTPSISPRPTVGGPSPSATLPPGTGRIALGVYVPASDVLAHGAAVQKYTQEVGKQPAFAWFSVKWQNASTGAYQPFDPRLLDQFRTLGIMPGLNWDASKGSALNPNQPDFSWKTIAAGKHDVYIQQVAAGAAAYHYPFLLRVLEEMDGNWYPWGYSVNGNTNPADFVTAWKHIVDIFRKEGATNVQFVWCLSAGVLNASRISQYGDTLKQIYPGDDYVDWVALDGYGALAGTPGNTLQVVFQPAYEFIKANTHRPIIFYEVGASENPRDPMGKANWITEGFLTTIPTVFPDVKAVAWFDGPADNGKEDWAVDTSQNSLNAWKQVVANPLYQASFR